MLLNSMSLVEMLAPDTRDDIVPGIVKEKPNLQRKK